MVSWFTTASDLEARVGAAVTMAGLSSQLNLQTADALQSEVGIAKDSYGRQGIMDAVLAAAQRNQCALKINLATAWWSTRLFLLAALAERLTQVRRILIVVTTGADTGITGTGIGGGTSKTGVPSPVTTATKAHSSKETFIGQVATGAILSIIGPKRTQLEQFQNWLQSRSMGFDDLSAEIEQSLQEWERLFNDQAYQPNNEASAKVDLTPELLQRWFRDAMLRQPLQIADLKRASVVDLLRLLDYPSDYVPVLTRHLPEKEGDPVQERVDIMDKKALDRRLARSYLVELMDRARIGRGSQ